jgi:signal transduction histidine kinase
MHSDKKLVEDLLHISQIPVVENMLEVICKTTGMGFSAIARVTEDSWVACSVRDEINFGLKPGGELKLETTICNEIRQTKKAVVIDHVAQNQEFCEHPTPKMYGFESYISVPIIRKNGELFGTLCAIDPKPRVLENNTTLGMFKLFAELIAFHLESVERLELSEKALQDINQQLYESNDENRQYRFISNHNLQEPLRKLRVFSNMVVKAASAENNDKVRQFAEKLSYNAQQFSMMIKDLAEFSNLDYMNGLFEDADLDKILHDVCAQLEIQIKLKSAVVQIGKLPTIHGIVPQLEQLFYHLISNSLKFSRPEVNPLIEITASFTSRYFEIRVGDNGPGIAPGHLEKIFDLFAKLEDSARLKGGGIGLSYCRKIVRNHGGRISAESVPGKGTTFIISLPVEKLIGQAIIPETDNQFNIN